MKKYNLYRKFLYNEYQLIYSSTDVKKVEQFQNKLFFKKYVARVVVLSILTTALITVFFTIYGIESHNLLYNKHETGFFAGLVISMFLNLLYIIIGIGFGRLGFDNEYCIKMCDVKK